MGPMSRSSAEFVSFHGQILEICHRFIDAAERGENPKIEDHLPDWQGEATGQLLRELILLERHYRTRNGEVVLAADFIHRFSGHESLIDEIFQDAFATVTGMALASSGKLSQGSMIGPYKLVKPLGKGAFGEVWLGTRGGALATTKVAIKLPYASASAFRVIREEAQSWARASGHPNVVPIIEADVYSGVVALISEYVEGGTLAETVRRTPGRRLPVSRSIETAIGILSGLEMLHARGIVHRDLKPANIMMQQGIPRLTDFGLAHSAGGGMGLTNIAGTPSYMAPEAYEGYTSVESDIWTVGVILFEMLEGRVPFSGSTIHDLIQEIRKGELQLASSTIPLGLRTVLMRAINKNADARYESATAMRAAISDCRRELALGSGAGGTENHSRHLAISVTGSMLADPVKVRQRLSALVTPYHAPLTNWYIGSNGVVDEEVAEYLIAEDQQVFVVGYSQDDLSVRMRRLVTEHDLPFVDAERENVPNVSDAPSKRDVFFATKSDLVILISENDSRGTKKLQRWLNAHRRDHFIVYI